MTGIRMTEDQYADLLRKRSASAPDRPPRGERKPAGTQTPAEASEAPSGPKFKSKAEARYAELLERQRRAGQIESWRYEAITLRIGLGARYSPDFLVVMNDGRMRLVEVKGHMKEAARVRLRVAVEMYPQFAWLLVWAKNGGFEPELLR